MISNGSEKPETRRKVLKEIGSAGVGGLILGTTEATADDWICTTDCDPTVVADSMYGMTNPYNYEREGNATVQWYSSDYADGKWTHEFAVTGAAGCEYNGGALAPSPELFGQRYKVQGNDGYIRPYVNSEFFGMVPSDGTGEVPDWASPLMDATVGAISVGSGWLLSANSVMRDKLKPTEGFDTTVPDGFGFTDIRGLGVWDTCHFHRTTYESDLYEPTVDVLSSVAESTTTSGYTMWADVEFSINPADGEPLSVLQENDPSLMTNSQKEELGKKKVPSDSSYTITREGEELDVQYTATRPPIRDVEINRSTTKEKVNSKGN